MAYLKQGAALDAAVFLSWFDARKEAKWLEENDDDGNTPLDLALQHNAPEAVVTALFEAWPDAVKEENNNGDTPLCLALVHKAPEAVVPSQLAHSGLDKVVP